MATTQNIVAGLPLLAFDGIPAPPYDVVTAAWENDLSPRRIPYVDGEVHDFTGRGPFTFTARLYFCNGLEQRNDLFPGLWNQWLPLLTSGDAKVLQHPVLGPVNARVKAGSAEARATVRSGIIVDATWIQTLLDPGSPPTLSRLDIAATIALAASNARLAAIASPKDKSFWDSIAAAFDTVAKLWGQVRTAIFTATLAVTTVTQMVGLVAEIVDEVRGFVDRNSTTYPVSTTAIVLWEALVAMLTSLRKVAPLPTRKTVTTAPTTLDAFATAHGNSLSQVMGLNLNALRMPIIPRGTTLTYYVVNT